MPADSDFSELLFSYGTLQLERVQIATFGRLMHGTIDSLRGFELDDLEIEDESVIATSGTSRHTMARFTGRASDVIPGMVFAITSAELRNADEYEVDAVTRVSVILDSGARAWAYVDARNPPPEG